MPEGIGALEGQALAIEQFCQGKRERDKIAAWC